MDGPVTLPHCSLVCNRPTLYQFDGDRYGTTPIFENSIYREHIVDALLMST